ncbi:Hypothetical predicted protein [Mytilus galloprovincialis]|uniref:Eph LBD domain-containing protein n=1 Tax=Mytilus galloprovincialis TaxID=29158 RepID=A0A8B6HKR3_MYTGA|nr:Hypothetical predicted protein [Mytilus galloprovincialis]
MTASKESFNLYFYEAESDIAVDVIPSWDATTYDLIDIITADHSEGYQNEENKLNITKRDIPLPKELRGVYLAFQDTGTCVSLMSLKVYYTVCPNITMDYAFFLETPVGSSPQALEKREGVCVANS